MRILVESELASLAQPKQNFYVWSEAPPGTVSVVRGRFLVVAGAVGLAVSLPASAARNSVEHFTVVSAKAGATLTFQSANSSQSAQTSGTVVLSASQKSSGKGSLPGRALASLKGTLKERVKTKRTPSDSSPYQETCANSHKVGGKGGITLQRVGEEGAGRLGLPAGEGELLPRSEGRQERDREDEARLLCRRLRQEARDGRPQGDEHVPLRQHHADLPLARDG